MGFGFFGGVMTRWRMALFIYAIIWGFVIAMAFLTADY
jgi:hypothetical protein